MPLEILPTRTGGAAENMATDFLLLQRYPGAAVPRFRHYEWRAPAFTFGYGQKLAFVRAQLPPDETFDLCRRPTGGGIVDHREDWTYALVIPRGHPLEEVRATQSYRLIHEALADALRAQGLDAITKPCSDETSEGPAARGTAQEEGLPAAGLAKAGICFQRAEIYDVVGAGDGTKLAGAAQKRNKHGLLFQGSIWKPAAGPAMDWQVFEDAFVSRLASALGTTAEPAPWPEFNEDEVSGLTEQYASPEWIGHR
jgi:lipoate-protein ligase A